MARTKISKVAKDLNVALPTVVEFLRGKGIDVDDNPKAYYFEQARNGVYARQAIITRALGIQIPPK